jgi:hypothetical protein
MNTRVAVRGLAAVLVAGAVLAAAGAASARVKLVTLPVRERVEIQLDHLDATLVEEERVVTLLKGTNHIDFSWSSTQIDKGTIQFRVVNMPLRGKRRGDPPQSVRPDGRIEQIRIIHVAYPPNENALVWEVYTEKPYAARVRISYLIHNLRRSFHYRAVADHEEKFLVLRNYIRVDNFSGEDFGASGVWAGFGNYFQRVFGLNEAKQLLLWKFPRVPITKTYTFDWWTGQKVPDEPDQRYVAMHYLLANDKAHGMGLFPLQNGKVRIFQKDGRGGEAFIGEDWGRFTPIDDRMKLYLGLARDVVVNRKVMKTTRHPVKGNLFDQELVIEYTIENFKTSPVVLDVQVDMNRLRNDFAGDHGGFDCEWEILDEGTTLGKEQIERKDAVHVVYHVPLEAAPKDPDEKVEPVKVTVHLMIRNVW